MEVMYERLQSQGLTSDQIYPYL